MTATATRARPAIFYGWYIVAAGGANFLAVSGLVFWGFSAFIDPMRMELGWPVAAIAIGSSIRSFEQGLLSPFIGYAIDRAGPRTMAVLGTLVSAAGLFLFSRSFDLWQYYLASGIIALGMSLGSTSPYNAAIVRWFVRKRGQALGIISAMTALSYFAVPIVTLTIEAVGWRQTLVLMSMLALVAGLPLSLVIRTEPQKYGLQPDGAASAPEPAPARGAAAQGSGGFTVAKALRTPAFYLLMLSFAAGSAIHGAVIVHIVPHLKTAGFSATTAGIFVGIFGMTQVILRIVAGWLGDIVGRRRLYAVSFLSLGVGFLLFANLNAAHAWMVPVWLTFHGIGHAGYSALSQVMTADYFGTGRFATLRGLNSILNMPLGVAFPIVAALAFDATGTYRVVFMLFGGFGALGAVWVLLAGAPARQGAASQHHAG